MSEGTSWSSSCVTTPRQRYRTFTGVIWAIGACAWLVAYGGMVAMGAAMVVMALILTLIRESVFAVEVRGLDKL
jgi:hypothetical protein